MTCDTLGLYARSVEDLKLLSEVFQMADDEPIPAEPPALKGAKIAFCKTPAWPKAESGTQNAFAKAQTLLKSHGAIVSELELPEEFSSIIKWHGNVLAGEGRTSFLGSKSTSISHFRRRILIHKQQTTCWQKKNYITQSRAM
jgi:Asp-tRNA(Asn)/Glu-tRNA(Gln) amidotransferase A subunit family amidase